jgi:hypothetical protein
MFPWNGKQHITGGVTQVHKAKDGPNVIGWGALDLSDPAQVDRARMSKPHMRGFDKKRL